jgi:hypothetical protein
MVNRALLARASAKGIPIPWLFPIADNPLEMILHLYAVEHSPALFSQPVKNSAPGVKLFG